MVRIAIVGASGYTGSELVAVLLRHPHVEITALFSHTHQGRAFAELFPRFRGRIDLRYRGYAVEEVAGLDAVFLALPHGEAAQRVPELLGRVECVIDLSGDFRFRDAAVFPRWYGFEHPASALLDQAAYGLPEWLPDGAYTAGIIANPGCYPTAALLAILPVARKEWLTPGSPIIVNALSGVSGAGRKPSQATHFCEVDESVRAYKVAQHQHTPEIEMGLELFGGLRAAVSFTPHLLPIRRGIYATVFLPSCRRLDQQAIDRAFQEAYDGQPFVRYLGPESPSIAGVANTNFCDLGAKWDARTGGVIVMSAIDNLLKGAAGQAVQNFNRKFGFPQTEGLLDL